MTPPGARDYAWLFAAYVTGLFGTGIAVVGLALLAFALAEEDAGVVVATALSIKAACYVVVAPVAAALTGLMPKRPLLVGLDLIRAGAILVLPFASALWHVYLAVFVFTAASAAFTPTYQALVPHLLPGQRDYARALAKSRIANEIETAASPLAAAGLLLVMSGRGLFLSAMALFLVSAACVLAARLPDPPTSGEPLARRLTAAPRLLVTTPGVLGLAPLHLVAAAGTAMVLVNTVVLVQGDLGLDGRATATALAVFGAGSVAGALAVPTLLARAGEKPTILAGCGLVAVGLFAGLGLASYAGLLALWAVIGVGVALTATPAPFVLRRLAPPERRVELYAALFAVANLALLAAFPLAGWAGSEEVPVGIGFAVLGLFAAGATVATALALPRSA